MINSFFNIQVQLTNKCNLRCIHCYQDDRIESDLDPERFLNWATSTQSLLSRWGTNNGLNYRFHYLLSGGEPLLYGSLGKVIEELHGKNNSISILTNGTLLERLASLPIAKIDGVQISFDGVQSIHDKVRGVGCFERSCLAVVKLKEAGVSVSVNCTLIQENISHLEEYIEYFHNLRVDHITFKRYIPKSPYDNLSPTPDQFNYLIKTFSSIDCIGFDDPLHLLGKSTACAAGCSAGFFGLAITSRGDILPCSKLIVPIGNIYENDFGDVWFKSPTLKALRQKPSYSKCNSCDHWKWCRGCRAFSFMTTGNLLGDDGYCQI